MNLDQIAGVAHEPKGKNGHGPVSALFRLES